MKLSIAIARPGLVRRWPPSAAGAAGAFTLVETMVTMAIFLLVLSGIMSSYMYGLRMFEFTKPKLSASDDARATISKLMTEVRTATLLRIGNGDLNTFTEVAVNSAQAGSALQVYPTTDTNTFTRYYWDSTVNQLRRTDSSAPGVFTILAQSVTNSVVFTAEDYTGSTLTNNLNNRVIGLTLQFSQIQYPVMVVGPGNLYDFYQLRTKITRRTLL